MARNLTQTETGTRSVAQCACHGDRAAFGVATPAAAYTCYPYDENVGGSKHHNPLGAVDQQIAAYDNDDDGDDDDDDNDDDKQAGAPRVQLQYGHYRL